MMLPLPEPPRSVCILRLSAIGDACHVVPIVRTLQQAWPATQLTWIIGRSEARLMRLLEGVEFITVDKRATLAGLPALRAALGGRRFEVLLHMQLALRASLAAACVAARVRLGFDLPRARELQWLFTNARIAARSREHVLDSFFGFPLALGVSERLLRWDLRLPAEAQAYARRLIPEGRPTLVISPCSSHALRNWRPERYAAVAAHAVARHGMQVILAGGPSGQERAMGAAIEGACPVSLTNQIGKDTLPELLALLARARVLVSPDSGPVHMATAVGTPVIGLYAATNPSRSGPYLSIPWCVDAYPEAARRFRGCDPRELPWTHKIEEPGVMDLIRIEQVTGKLDELLGSRT
ncbi:MAG TPA: glycosyltransferase family 9 protein [Steroidobacteraceae bacterium]|nr:glycosyltransferase family 9 protein [Steroidobacteraceae bacterium]